MIREGKDATQPESHWGWKGPLEILEFHLPAQAGSAIPGCPGPHQLGFEHPPNTHSTASLCNLFQCLTTLTAKTSIFSCSVGDSCILMCPHCPLCCRWALERRVWCSLHSHQCIYTHWQDHRIMEWFGILWFHENRGNTSQIFLHASQSSIRYQQKDHS